MASNVSRSHRRISVATCARRHRARRGRCQPSQAPSVGRVGARGVRGFYLVVAATPGVELAGGSADQFAKAAFVGGVDVLVRRLQLKCPAAPLQTGLPPQSTRRSRPPLDG